MCGPIYNTQREIFTIFLHILHLQHPHLHICMLPEASSPCDKLSGFTFKSLCMNCLNACSGPLSMTGSSLVLVNIYLHSDTQLGWSGVVSDRYGDLWNYRYRIPKKWH